MLVRLISSTSGEMIMFAEHAHVLFEWMGKECTAHGVFTKEQLPVAIARLRRGVEEERLVAKRLADECRAGRAEESDEDGDETKEKNPDEVVSLGQRAQPLIHLMEWTLREKGFILWEAAQGF